MMKKTFPFINRLFYKKVIIHRSKELSSQMRLQFIHTSYTNPAKGKNIKKDKKKTVIIDENELNEYLNFEKLIDDINRPIESFKDDLIQQVSLRSSIGAIENTKIVYDGNPYTIQDLAEINKKNPKMFVLDFSCFPDAIGTVVKTFQESHLNLNVQQEGTKLIVPIPKVTREHRELLAKKAKMYFVKCKDSIREVQMKYTKKLNNVEKLGSEVKFRITEQLVALGDKHIKIAEDMLKNKQNELLPKDDD
ncbi:ribosome recycling factor, putative [Pediculus humanus corporis]|uniref:Ribosome-recycling factor, mitochondrial n=1 Tax=Pediculus humanus subsp. corporis TaxID=121224 RepID=E0VZE6_PEDHC|nr:ribosome recycling factor, putative [Pediculus humanus corporis]EEB18752.1 ribosome recycling factor, putative [Pediculus humanus corporis]